jgi:hypothetical protein
MEARKPRKSDAQRLVLRSSEAALLRGAPEINKPAETERTPELHLCRECGSDLVYPTNWAPAAAQRWSVQLRCPDCEWRGEGVYDQDAVDRFDEILDGGSEAILDDLTKLTHANMSDEIDRFVDAIQRDLVLPEDF